MSILTEFGNELSKVDWSTVVSYLLTSGVVAAVFQLVKKHVTIGEKKLAERSKAVVVPLAGVFSAIPTYINYLASDHGQAWVHVVPKEFAFIFAGATFLHAWLISPGYAKLSTSLSPWVRAAQSLRADAQAAKATSVVVAPTEPVATDFDPTAEAGAQ